MSLIETPGQFCQKRSSPGYTPHTNFAAYPIVYSTDSADYCYEQPTNMVLPVKYAAGANCNANPSTNGSQNYLCPHFVTVCTRN